MGFLYSQLLVTLPYPATKFTGQTVIVTGSNVGLGLEAARHIVRLDAAKVILAVRNTSAGNDAKTDIEQTTGRTGVLEVWPLDLSSYQSVKSFAARAIKDLDRIDVLLENAGIATHKFAKAEENESTITVNVVSTFLLALLLLPKLRATARDFQTTPHLAIVTSEVHGYTNLPEWKAPHTLDDMSDEHKANMVERYSATKLIEVFVVRAIAPKIKDSGVVLNMLNPGLCHSSLSRNLGGLRGWVLYFMKSVLARTTEAGSRTLVAAATAGSESHGQYMTDSKVDDGALSSFVKSEDGQKAQEKLWKEVSQKLESIQPGILKNLE